MTPAITVVHRLLKRALRIGRSMLREIFDESAYARFLQRRQLANSPKAYAEFLVEYEARAQRRPRCC